MADPNPTTGDLFKAKAVTAEDVDALLSAYEANPGAGALRLGEGYRLDVQTPRSTRTHPPPRLRPIPRRRAGGA